MVICRFYLMDGEIGKHDAILRVLSSFSLKGNALENFFGYLCSKENRFLEKGIVFKTNSIYNFVNFVLKKVI